MDKYGVVSGTVKTASADNEGDPVGSAAKCINDARASLAKAHELRENLKFGVKDPKETKEEK